MRAPAAPAHAAKTPTIAVLPFVDASSDPGNDDFIDGLTSEVIRNLAVIDGLQVRSQTSSFFFKDRPRDMRAVAKRAGRSVVEAFIQSMAKQAQIHARSCASKRRARVVQRFDRTLDDVFAIQERFRGDRHDCAALDRTTALPDELAEYDLYLRARRLLAEPESAEQPRPVEQVTPSIVNLHQRTPEWPIYAAIRVIELRDALIGCGPPPSSAAAGPRTPKRTRRWDHLRARVRWRMQISSTRAMTGSEPE